MTVLKAVYGRHWNVCGLLTVLEFPFSRVFAFQLTCQDVVDSVLSSCPELELEAWLHLKGQRCPFISGESRNTSKPLSSVSAHCAQTDLSRTPGHVLFLKPVDNRIKVFDETFVATM